MKIWTEKHEKTSNVCFLKFQVVLLSCLEHTFHKTILSIYFSEVLIYKILTYIN